MLPLQNISEVPDCISVAKAPPYLVFLGYSLRKADSNICIKTITLERRVLEELKVGNWHRIPESPQNPRKLQEARRGHAHLSDSVQVSVDIFTTGCS